MLEHLFADSSFHSLTPEGVVDVPSTSCLVARLKRPERAIIMLRWEILKCY